MSEDNSTRDRLIRGARRVFAENGPSNATVRDICAQAGANVASVSYHFGGKDKLYGVVLQDYLERSRKRHPRDQGVNKTSPPEERLRAYLRSLLLQTLGDDNKDDERLGKLLMQEFIEPTQHFGEFFERHCREEYGMLLGIIRELLPEADEVTVSRCASSIIGQCVLFDFAKEAIARVSPAMELKADNVEPLLDFIMRFSMGGIAIIRQELQAQ